MIENTSQYNNGFGKPTCILEQKSFRHTTFKSDSKFLTFVPKLKFVQPFLETVGFDSYDHVKLILKDTYLNYNGHVFEKKTDFVSDEKLANLYYIIFM
jgi:hypothetical protein